MRQPKLVVSIASGLAVLLAAVAMNQPVAQVGSDAGTTENYDLQADELADRFSSATPHLGAISKARVQIEQCILTVEIQFDRPCSERTRGEYLLRATNTIDLMELDTSVKSIVFSSRPREAADIVHWGFSEEISGRMRRINEVVRAETARYQATGVDGGERAEKLTELSRRLLGEYGVNSRVSLDYCLQETAVYPFLFESVAFSLSSDKSRELVDRLASYAEARCAR